MSDYYDKQGKPLELLEWAKRLEDMEYKRVAVDEIDNRRVSTDWLGLSHQLGEGPPLIFETMIFGTDEEYCARYSTEAQAIAGHAEVVRKLRAGEKL